MPRLRKRGGVPTFRHTSFLTQYLIRNKDTYTIYIYIYIYIYGLIQHSLLNICLLTNCVVRDCMLNVCNLTKAQLGRVTQILNYGVHNFILPSTIQIH